MSTEANLDLKGRREKNDAGSNGAVATPGIHQREAGIKVFLEDRAYGNQIKGAEMAMMGARAGDAGQGLLIGQEGHTGRRCNGGRGRTLGRLR